MRANKFTISNFQCVECGNMFPLPRPKAKSREKGHIKDLWCPCCRKKVKTMEIRFRDTFRTMSGEVLY